MYAHDDFEPDHTSSPTDTMIQDLQLYGYRPAPGEADPRITPEDQVVDFHPEVSRFFRREVSHL
ncbi:hypothetical protein [Gemmobacter lutimaris]|nr:hypothetical protein [Gemmobacter lutimaris]